MENNFDDLETIYFNLHCPITASPAINHKPLNSHSKPRSLPSAYETLSADKALLVPETERLNDLLFSQLSGKEADKRELASISQAEFEAFQNRFIPSKEESRLMQILFSQVAGNAEAVNK